MYCTQCGNPMNNAAANFCPQCGQETPESKGRRAFARRRLYRSRYDRKIAGVCGGLADYLDVDPTLIRVLAVTALICSAGIASVVYLVAIAVIDEEPVLISQGAQQQQA